MPHGKASGSQCCCLELHIASEDVCCIDRSGSAYSLVRMQMSMHFRRDKYALGFVQVSVPNSICFCRSQLEVGKDVKQPRDMKRYL